MLSIGGSDRAAHGPTHGQRLEEHHDGDGERARQQLVEVIEGTGATGVGSPDGTGAISATPCSSMDATATSSDAADHRDERTGDLRAPPGRGASSTAIVAAGERDGRPS